MKWILLSERLPKEGQGVLITDGKTMVTAEIGDYFERKNCYFWSPVGFSGYEWEYDFEYEDVTHWMELPEAPK